ncbi:hypothetical protein C8R42DRAFT_781193 [Lentinula raphanica]|nr:hypothetical protein C8R42DRAFT_781193 [Lentinula raphanica]
MRREENFDFHVFAGRPFPKSFAGKTLWDDFETVVIMRFNILYPLFILFAVVHAAPVGEAPSAAGLNQEAVQAGSSDLAIPSGAIQALQENEVGVVFSKEGTRDSSQDSKLDTLFFENSPVKVTLFRNLRANYRIFGDKAHSSPECPFVQFITFDKEGRIYDVKMSTRVGDAYNNWSIHDVKTGKKVGGVGDPTKKF